MGLRKLIRTLDKELKQIGAVWCSLDQLRDRHKKYWWDTDKLLRELNTLKKVFKKKIFEDKIMIHHFYEKITEYP